MPHARSDIKRRTGAPLVNDHFVRRNARAHLEALTNTLSPKLTHLLPPELVRKVVEFYLHAGFYPFTEVPAAAPTA